MKPVIWRAGEAIVSDMEQGVVLTRIKRSDGQFMTRIGARFVRSMTVRLLLLAGWIEEASTTQGVVTYRLATRQQPVDGSRLRKMLAVTS